MTQMLSIAAENENDRRQFHNWEGKGAAHILLPLEMKSVMQKAANILADMGIIRRNILKEGYLDLELD